MTRDERRPWCGVPARRALGLCIVTAALVAPSSRLIAAEPIRDEDGRIVGNAVRPAKTTLSVTSRPSSSKDLEVKVIDADSGSTLCDSTPCTFQRVLGSQRSFKVRLEATGHSFAHVELSRDNWKADVVLKPCPKIEIKGAPKDATLIINGTTVGPADALDLTALVAQRLRMTAIEGCPLHAAIYGVRLRAPGYLDYTNQIDLSGGPVEPLKVMMRTNEGSLVILSSVADVEVLVDGKVRAFIPQLETNLAGVVINGVAPGKREVSLRFRDDGGSNPAWGSFKNRLEAEVREGEETKVYFDLPSLSAPGGTFSDQMTDRADLRELCDAASSSCSVLGWAYRWGVGGPPDSQAAAEAFGRACESAGRRSDSNACASYLWLVDTGLARPTAKWVSEAREKSARACTELTHGPTRAPVTTADVQRAFLLGGLVSSVGAPSSSASSDPLTPCVRSRLTPTARALADPTRYADHDLGVTITQHLGLRLAYLYSSKFPISELRVAFGTNAGRFGFGVYFAGNRMARLRRTAAGVSKDEELYGVGGGIFTRYGVIRHLAVGLAGGFRAPWAGGDANGAGAQSSWTVEGDVAWSLSRITGRGLYIALVTSVDWVSPEQTSDDALIEDLRKTGNVDAFLRAWDMRNDNPSVRSIALGLSIGWVLP